MYLSPENPEKTSRVYIAAIVCPHIFVCIFLWFYWRQKYWLVLNDILQ